MINDARLKKVREEMTEKVISGLEGIGYLSEQEKAVYRKNIEDKIASKQLCTEQRIQGGLTNAFDYNRNAYELYIDILTVFDYLNSLSDDIDAQQNLAMASLSSVSSMISSLNDKLDEIQAVIGTKGHPECFMDNLRTNVNRETDKDFLRERYGNLLASVNAARFNPEQETLTLGYTRQQNVLMYKSGVQLGEAEITRQYGSGLIKVRNPEEKLNNALDTSRSNYWAETILCDAEFSLKGTGFEDFEYMRQYNRSFYDLPKGALCEICIRFEAMTKVNELILNPFGRFPLDVVAVRYSYTDSEDSECYDILTPDGSKYSWLTQSTLRKETAFHFPEIVCKKLYILINQLHCIKDTFLISSNQMFKNELWYSATSNESECAELPDSMIFKPIYMDRGKEDPVWTYINNKMNTMKNVDINTLLLKSNEKMLPCTKYQYTYGFYNIIPNYVEFQNTGVYVTKEIQASGIVKSISITTQEEHFESLDNGRKVTDIEYYITTSSSPAYTDWHPLCPSNKEYIHCERLLVDYDVCYLLHEAVCRNVTRYDEEGNPYTEMVRPIIRMDDQKLTEDVDYILHFNKNNNVESVEIPNADYFAVYTAEYMPAEESKTLDLLSGIGAPGHEHEIINGTGASSYCLKEYPFYSMKDPHSTNSFVKVSDIQTGAWVSQHNGAVECVTDKLNTGNSYKNMKVNKAGASVTGTLQYYTDGRYIYFNRPIKTSEKIEVSYPCYSSSIRLKMIFRRNSKRDFWMTPVLHGYKIEFTTI